MDYKLFFFKNFFLSANITLLAIGMTFAQAPFKIHSDFNLPDGGITLSNSKQHYGQNCDTPGAFAIDSTTSYPLFCKKNDNNNNTWDYIKTGISEEGVGGVVLQVETLVKSKYEKVEASTTYIAVDTISIAPVSAESSFIIDASISTFSDHTTAMVGIFRLDGSGSNTLLEEASLQTDGSNWVSPLTTFYIKDDSPVLIGDQVKYVIKMKHLQARSIFYNHYYVSGSTSYTGAKSFYKITEVSKNGTYFTQSGDTITSTSSVQGPIAFQAFNKTGTVIDTIRFSNEIYDSGNYFDGTYFKAPKAGPYKFCWGGIGDNDTTTMYLLLHNGSPIVPNQSGDGGQLHTVLARSESGYDGVYPCYIMNLSIGDSMSVFVETGHDHGWGHALFSGYYLGTTKTENSYTYVNGASAHNLLINGGMRVLQRDTSSTTNGYGSVDRWKITWGSGTITHSQEAVQSSDGDPYKLGFRKYLKVETSANTNITASEAVIVEQIIEAQDIATSGWDYSTLGSGSNLTLSFWVKSSVTGTNVYKAVVQTDGTTKKQHAIPFSIDNANTWEYKTLTFLGGPGVDIPDDNTAGLRVQFYLDYGSGLEGGTESSWENLSTAKFNDAGSGWVSTNGGDIFGLTGVQLEVGNTAGAFEKRKYAEELRLCQRYYQRIGPPAGKHRDFIANTVNTSGDVSFFYVPTIVQLRIVNPLIQWVPATYNPTTIYYGGHSSANADNGIAIDGNNNINITNTPNIVDGGTSIGATLRITHYATDLGQSSPILRIRNQSYFEFDAELN